MAAYAALVSLMHIINQIKNHPYPPVFLDKSQVESLTEKVTFLQEFLEGYSHVGYSKEPDALEMRIVDAAYAAEDVIESHIVDQIRSRSTIPAERISSVSSGEDINLTEAISPIHIVDEIPAESTSHGEKISFFSSDEDINLTEETTSIHPVDQNLARSTSYRESIGSDEEISSGSSGSKSRLKKNRCFNCFRGLWKAKSHENKISFSKSYRGPQDATSHGDEILHSYIRFYQSLRKAIEDMNSIKKEATKIKKKMGVQDQRPRSSTAADSLRSFSTGQNTVVGLDEVLLEIMDKLTGGQLDRQIIPIVGMGGIGKTTLARKIYQDQLIVQHFDIFVWITISQEYKMREILLELLQEGMGNLSQVNEYELRHKLHKRLSGRRYLIIMDDIWDIEVWDQLKFFFPDNNNGSRIMLTTRLSNLASQVAYSHGINMAFLDEDNSWNLFSEIVFGKEGCPLELKKIGRKIVKNCKGLPLSIVVIGGLLAEFKHSQEYWEYIEKNLSSVVNSEDSENCLKVLHMSYSQLPVYLKPCFLYMGVFSKDSIIRVSTLVKLWVAEGFLKPITGKSLEVVAREYLKELIDRNLILVHKLGSTGSIKDCLIHDLVRDLCLRESQKERFYNVKEQSSHVAPPVINTQRRIVISKSISMKQFDDDALQSMSVARSLICYSDECLSLAKFRFLRILKTQVKDLSYHRIYYPLADMFKLFNSRYLAFKAPLGSNDLSSVNLLWNLYTLIVHSDDKNSLITAPVEIWNMRQLRHVELPGGFSLPDPPSGNVDRGDDIVLENLQRLQTIRNFKCGQEVVKRIPNIKKLKVSYHPEVVKEVSPNYHLNNIGCLHQLESFDCYSTSQPKLNRGDFLQSLNFPHSLKKLTIGGWYVNWEDMLGKIGSLPFLEKLQLIDGLFRSHEWVTVEGQFRSLKCLIIEGCDGFECWMTESFHFPCLEHLVLHGLKELKNIPSEIGEIPTLQSIELKYCGNSVIMSAQQILEEQKESYGEVTLRVRVQIFEEKEALTRLANRNFQVQYTGCKPSISSLRRR